MTGIDLVREVFGPETAADEADFILWELTSFPFVASGYTAEDWFRRELKRVRRNDRARERRRERKAGT